MKIIIPGKTPRERLNGRQLVCEKCNGKFEITSEDSIKFYYENRTGEFKSIECPTDGCNQIIYVT